MKNQKSYILRGIRSRWFKPHLALEFPDCITLIKVLIHLLLKHIPWGSGELAALWGSFSTFKEFFPLEYYFLYQANIYFHSDLTFWSYFCPLKQHRRKFHRPSMEECFSTFESIMNLFAHWSVFCANNPKFLQLLLGHSLRSITLQDVAL